MKVAVFELSSPNHSVMIYNWFHICKKNNWEFKLFTTEEIYKTVCHDIDMQNNELFILKKVSLLEFYRATKEMSKLDVVVLTSLQSYFFHYLILLLSSVSFIVTIHNLNAWFLTGSKTSLKGKLKSIVRGIWKKRSRGFIVNSQNMLEYALSNQLTRKSIIAVPFSMRHKYMSLLVPSVNAQKFTIVYPGMVSTKRKSYDLFLRFAKDNPAIKFILLGKVILDEGGQGLLDDINNQVLSNVVSYNSYVEQLEFDRVMREANLIFSFINIDYYNDGIKERYGESKDSGISYLMLEYGLPLLVNDGFVNFSPLDNATFHYDSYKSLSVQFEKFKASYALNSDLRSDILKARSTLNIESVSVRVRRFVIDNVK
jgi:hypothetical protein